MVTVLQRAPVLYCLLMVFATLALRAQTDTARHGNMWFQCDKKPLAISFANPDSAVAVDTFTTKFIQGGICNAEGKLEFYMHSPHMITIGEVAPTDFYTSVLNNAAHQSLANNPIDACETQPLFLPVPGKKERYYVFNHANNIPGLFKLPDRLVWHEIDMRAENGSGRIVRKNQVAHSFDPAWLDPTDFFPNYGYALQLPACRHANGEDWWIVAQNYYRDTFYVFLATADTVQFSAKYAYPDARVIARGYKNSWTTFRFSPSGRYLMTTSYNRYRKLYHFDRCTGKIRFAREFSEQSRSLGAVCNRLYASTYGAAFSPSERYLYLSNDDSLVQQDLRRTDPLGGAATLDINPTWGGLESGENTSKLFGVMQPGPEGKIYMRKNHRECNNLYEMRDSFTTFWGVIDNPNAPGLACGYDRSGLSLNGRTADWTLHYMPDYNTPPLRFREIAGKDTMFRMDCPGDSVVLGGHHLSGVRYRWRPARGLSSDTAATPRAAPRQTTTYTLFAQAGLETCWPGDTMTHTVTVVVPPAPRTTASLRRVCPNEAARMPVTAAPGWSYQWRPETGLSDPETAAPTVRPERTITYTLVSAHPECGMLRDTVRVEVAPLPEADFVLSDTLIYAGETLRVADKSINAAEWTWDFGIRFGYGQNPGSVAYPDTGYYAVRMEVASADGCLDDATRFVRVDAAPPFLTELPNAFSPNNDGNNDRFVFPTGGYADFHLRVFNRWGKLVFESRDPGDFWDGTVSGVPAPEGVYSWSFQATAPDGRRLGTKGTVTLIR